jgi:predicted transcriptional regulator
MSSSPRLGELERAVLEQLWSRGPDDWSTVREVHEALAAKRGIAYTTVMTVLGRLAKKSLVHEQRDERAYLYRAAASRDELTAELMRGALDELGTDDRRTAFVHFVDTASPEDVAALREALAELES